MLENIGIGIDIVDIKRFQEKPFEKNQRFYQKIFSESEIKHCLQRGNPSQIFASKFAVKEAVIKSINKQIDFLNILIDYSNSKPFVMLQNDNSYTFHVSISHEKSHAIATVISKKRTSYNFLLILSKNKKSPSENIKNFYKNQLNENLSSFS